MTFNGDIVYGLLAIGTLFFSLNQFILRRYVSLRVFGVIQRAASAFVLIFVAWAAIHQFILPIAAQIGLYLLFGTMGVMSASFHLSNNQPMRFTIDSSEAVSKLNGFLRTPYAVERTFELKSPTQATYILSDPFSKNTVVINVENNTVSIYGLKTVAHKMYMFLKHPHERTHPLI